MGYSYFQFLVIENLYFMDKAPFHISIETAENLLQKETNRFVKVIENKTMSVEYFAPKNIDTQSPHQQDELYIIIEGTSDFFRDGETIQCKKGDVIFVPAKMEHRFINFSEDFATWVVFYGEETI